MGFGDYHPENSFERIICILIFLFGNAIFGYIIGNFNEMISEFKRKNSDFEDSQNLNRFFNLIVRFNGKKPLPGNIRLRIEKFFEYKWNHDRNQALHDEEGQKLLSELPEEVQKKIYIQFFFFCIFLAGGADSQAEGGTGGRTGRQTDGQTDGWAGGRTGKRSDGRTAGIPI